MHIKITSVAIDKDTITVGFRTRFGAARGIWKDTSPPAVGASFAVELDIDEELAWGDTITASALECARVDSGGDHPFIGNGLLESIDDDGFTVIRFEHNIVICFTAGIPGEFIGRWVVISAACPGIYPDHGMPVRDLDEE